MSSLAALALVGLAVGFWYNGRLQAALREAGTQRVEADRQRRHSESLELHIRYERDVKLAQQAWREAHIEEALALLDLWRPTGTDGPDLRGWEWYYVRGICSQGYRTLAVPAATGARAIAFHPDSRRVAIAGWDGTIAVWDAIEGSLLTTWKGHDSWLNDVTFSPDGRSLASSGEDKTVRLWDLAGARETARYDGRGSFAGVAYSPDGRRLAAGCDDGTVTLWSVGNDREARRFAGHKAGVMGVAFSPDGRVLASCGRDRTVGGCGTPRVAPLCARWRGTASWSAAWRSVRTVKRWPRPVPIGRSSSGTLPPGGNRRH